MMLTTRARYAVMALADLAADSSGGPVRLNVISERQDIAVSYLEQIFAQLRRCGVVKAVKGPGGGYLVDVDLNKLTIADIIDAVEENVKMTRCSKEVCVPGGGKCLTHNLWKGLTGAIRGYLENISVQDVLDGKL